MQNVENECKRRRYGKEKSRGKFTKEESEGKIMGQANLELKMYSGEKKYTNTCNFSRISLQCDRSNQVVVFIMRIYHS